MINIKTSKNHRFHKTRKTRDFAAQKIKGFSRNQRFLGAENPKIFELLRPRKSFLFSRESQSWSIDIALGVIVFMSAFFIFYSLLDLNPTAKASNLKEEASSVIRQIGSEEAPLSIVEGNEVKVSRLNELKNLSYDELKRRLRVGDDFCIYMEDEKGNIVLINNSYRGIGSPDINLSGTPCSQK